VSSTPSIDPPFASRAQACAYVLTLAFFLTLPITLRLAGLTGREIYAALPNYAGNAAFLERDSEPTSPFITLLVSGGHSQLVEVASPIDLQLLGRTRDDAAGEAFDKTARLLGLPFPGGPEIDRLARDGDPTAIAFPRHRAPDDSLDMSFSGLKTSVRYFLEKPAGKMARPADVAASFQAAIVDVLIDRLERAVQRRPYTCAVLSGGVAANSALQAAFSAWGQQANVPTNVPQLGVCTDNAGMIAAAAGRQSNSRRSDPEALSADPDLPFTVGPPAMSKRVLRPPSS